MIVSETNTSITLVVTAALAERMAKRKLFRRAHVHAPYAEETQHSLFNKTLEIEPYTNLIAHGHFATMGSFSYTWSKLEPDMVVGRYCSISWNMQVFGMQHPMGSISTSAVMYAPGDVSLRALLDEENVTDYPFVHRSDKAAPKIGHDVWIGMNVTLARGISISTGAIIAAGAVVTKDVEPYAIVGGNPARLIRYRFSPETCRRMLASHWWDYKLTSLRHLNMHDPERFLEAFESAVTMGQVEPFAPAPIRWTDMRDMVAEAAR